jgi:hypothetical protein
MAKLTLIRPSEGLHDERKFKIYINGVITVILKQKSSTQIEVPDNPFEIQVVSNLGRSRKLTVDPAATDSAELRINKKMHKYNPGNFAPTIVVFSGIAFASSESVIVKVVAVAAFLAAVAWAIYALRIRREEWILINPHLKR